MAGRNWQSRWNEQVKELARVRRRFEDRFVVEEGLLGGDCQAPPGLAFDPNWRTADVIAVARHLAATHDFSALPVLGDALIDAGCDHAEVIGHCMKPGPHLRRCWVLDHVLRQS